MDRGQHSAGTAHLQVSAWGHGGVRCWVFGGGRWSVMSGWWREKLVTPSSTRAPAMGSQTTPSALWLPVKPEDQFLVGSNAVLMT